MKKVHLVFILTILFTVSCSESLIEDNDMDNSVIPVTYPMSWNASKPSYEPQTKAETASWSAGDKIYLLINVGTNNITGEAMYENDKWSLSLNGSFGTAGTYSCKAWFFEGQGQTSGQTINMTQNTAIYEDLNGSCVYDGDEVSVAASLTPLLGRVRLAGTYNEKVKVFGLNTPKSFDLSTGTISYTQNYFADTVLASNYTPYIYGKLSDSSNPRFYVITSKSAFTKYCNSDFMKGGESGWLTIPTSASHFGWNEYLDLTIKGYSFIMMPIYREDEGVTKPYLFLIAETEMTEGLYNSVYNLSNKTSKKPKTDISNLDAMSCAVILSSLSSLPFCLPTISDWQFAFGNYTYSGSNNIDEVAWYASTSDGSLHDVRSLAPNEYGLYDMSGNADEWCRYTETEAYYHDIYYYIYKCGGYYDIGAEGCTSSASSVKYIYSFYNSVEIGFRLAIKF